MVFITAEIGINHNGDVEIGKKLIDIAKEAGCDAVKFQKRNIEKVYSKEILESKRDSPWGTTTRDQKLGLEFEKQEYDEIDKYCKQKKIEWYCSAWDVDSQLFLQNSETLRVLAGVIIVIFSLQLIGIINIPYFIAFR